MGLFVAGLYNMISRVLNTLDILIVSHSAHRRDINSRVRIGVPGARVRVRQGSARRAIGACDPRLREKLRDDCAAISDRADLR